MVNADIPGEDVGVIWPLAKAGDVAVVDVLEPVVGPKLDRKEIVKISSNEKRKRLSTLLMSAPLCRSHAGIELERRD